MEKEIDQFLQDLNTDQPEGTDVMDLPLNPEPEKAKEEGEEPKQPKENDDNELDENGELKPRNRRERRLMRKLNEERESSIFLSGKLAAREETQRVVTEEQDYLKAVERIYGTETPEAQLATDLLKKAIVGARDDAKAQALAEYRAERQREIEEVRKADNMLNDIVDEIEDTYDVTLNTAQEKAYFELLKKMSPKDDKGNVTSLADPHAVWEVFQDRLKKRGTDNQAKVLSDRSMVQSGAQKDSTLQTDVTTRFLADNGII